MFHIQTEWILVWIMYRLKIKMVILSLLDILLYGLNTTLESLSERNILLLLSAERGVVRPVRETLMQEVTTIAGEPHSPSMTTAEQDITVMDTTTISTKSTR